MAKKFKVTLKRSLIGCTQSQRKTVEALGLRKRHGSVVLADNPANRGQILKVQHLLDVEVQG
jgi:large subunit ribosomal protein L30